MAEFLKDSQLTAEIENLIENADEFLYLISPYIKLHDRIKNKLLIATRKNAGVYIVVVFGKNEDDVSKSISKEDFEFLKSLPQIKICHEPRLHAKFYASEDFSIITSMNLHQFSQNTNIEAGIKLQSKKWMKHLNADTLEAQTLKYFDEVIEDAKIIFQKEAIGKSSMFGLKQEFSHSEIQTDNTEAFFQQKNYAVKQVNIRNNSFNIPSQQSGYCIRTGKPIPFNSKHPMCDEAYNSWSRYKDENYKEKYCHFSGEQSNGETSYSKPILRKNWNKAKQLFNL